MLRCKDLAIGYGERKVAEGDDLEIDAAWAAIVGDNGQGRRRLLGHDRRFARTARRQDRWGHATQLGVYAQHVYTSLPDKQTVLDYMEYHAPAGTKTQEILDMAGALLFAATR